MEIKFKNVSYKHILSNLDLNIEEGQIIGLVGASGSGKTALVELIDALATPTSGSIKVGTITINNKKKIKDINSLRANVGYVFANTEEQFFNPTVKDEIAFSLKCFKYKLDTLDNHIADALKMVGLSESYLERDPFSLSAGEMKKVAIASVLAFNPKVIILDEPTSSLDSKSKKNLIRIIRTLKTRYNKTIIIVSQDTDMIHKIVDYVYVLNSGKIVLSGKKYDVFKDEETLESYGVKAPKLITFSNLVLKNKKVKLGYRDEINDLIKDVYRNVK